MGGVRVQLCSQVYVGAGGWMAGCSTLLVTVLIASVGEALPEIIHSIPKDSDSRLYGVEACGGWGWGVETDNKQKCSPLSNYQGQEVPLRVWRRVDEICYDFFQLRFVTCVLQSNIFIKVTSELWYIQYVCICMYIHNTNRWGR